MKGIRTQILLGVSFREVAESLTRRKFESSRVDAEWMEDLLSFLFEEDNHSIQFRSKKLRNKPNQTFILDEGTVLFGAGQKLYYYDCHFEDHHKAAEKDMKRLNRIILDLYEIKKHAPPSQENKSKAQEIGRQIKSLKKKLEETKAEIEKLERRKKALA